jgi:hypothetical protein
VAFRAGVFERVAREARTLVEHGLTGVRTRFEKSKRNVTAGRFIMAAFAGFRLMACGA